MRRGRCDHCNRETWINQLNNRKYQGEVCEDCFDKFSDPSYKCTFGGPNPHDSIVDDNPSQQNAIRELEDG